MFHLRHMSRKAQDVGPSSSLHLVLQEAHSWKIQYVRYVHTCADSHTQMHPPSVTERVRQEAHNSIVEANPLFARISGEQLIGIFELSARPWIAHGTSLLVMMTPSCLLDRERTKAQIRGLEFSSLTGRQIFIRQFGNSKQNSRNRNETKVAFSWSAQPCVLCDER